jgi:hypothetical protein
VWAPLSLSPASTRPTAKQADQSSVRSTRLDDAHFYIGAEERRVGHPGVADYLALIHPAYGTVFGCQLHQLGPHSGAERNTRNHLLRPALVAVQGPTD